MPCPAPTLPQGGAMCSWRPPRRRNAVSDVSWFLLAMLAQVGSLCIARAVPLLLSRPSLRSVAPLLSLLGQHRLASCVLPLFGGRR